MKIILKNIVSVFDEKESDVVKKFLRFIQAKLTLDKDLTIVFVEKRDNGMTTGVRLPKNLIHILVKNRLLIDILRTISHEWVHEYQHQKMGLKNETQTKDIGGTEENMANILSGIYMKQFQKKFPKLQKVLYGETMNESILTEISPKSYGVEKFLQYLKDNPEKVKELGFGNFKELKDYVIDGTYEEFSELQSELEKIHLQKNKYINSEMDEIERAVQDLSRDKKIDTSVQELVTSFLNADKVDLTEDIWSKLENTESNKIKKGEMKKVVALANKYNKTSPMKLKKAIISGDYEPPMILKLGEKYHLVAGNTRLCTAAALGITPKVLIAEI